MKIFGRIIGGFYASFFTFVCFCFMFVVFLGQIFTPSYYEKIFKSLDVYDYKAKDFDFIVDGYDEDISLGELLVDELIKDTGIEEAKAKEIIEDDNIKDLFGQVVSNIVANATGSADGKAFTSEGIYELFGKYSLTEEECANLAASLNSEVTDIDRLDDDIIKVIDFASGKKIIITFGAFVVISFLILALLTWSFRLPFTYIGSSFTVIGIILLFIRFSIGFISNTLFDVGKDLLLFITNDGEPFFKYGTLFLVIGVAMIFFSGFLKAKSVVKNITHKNDNKTSTPKSDEETKTLTSSEDLTEETNEEDTSFEEEPNEEEQDDIIVNLNKDDE